MNNHVSWVMNFVFIQAKPIRSLIESKDE